MSTRAYLAPDGSNWEVRVVSTGKSSGYLNQKVQRPIVEFACTDVPLPRRYAMIAKAMPDSLEELDDAGLSELFALAKTH